MKKAASIFLRAEIEPRDIELLIHWMENPHITQYLNEEPSVIRSLQQLLLTVPAPMLTFHFNRWGRFFLVCRSNGDNRRRLQLSTSGTDYSMHYLHCVNVSFGNHQTV